MGATKHDAGMGERAVDGVGRAHKNAAPRSPRAAARSRPRPFLFRARGSQISTIESGFQLHGRRSVLAKLFRQFCKALSGSDILTQRPSGFQSRSISPPILWIVVSTSFVPKPLVMGFFTAHAPFSVHTT